MYTKTNFQMLSNERQIFLDDTLKPAENYSKEAYCWYHIPILSTSFKDGTTATKAVNDWANEASIKSLKAIHPKNEDKKSTRLPVAGDPDVLKNDLVVIASSIHLQIRWANKLFQIKDTKMNQSFKLEKTESRLVSTGIKL